MSEFTTQGEIHTYRGYRLDDANARLVHKSGTVKLLRQKSLVVFVLLAQNNGSLVRKDELINAAWPDSAVTDDSLVQCIGDIRRILGDSKRRTLITRPRQGYALIPDLRSEQSLKSSTDTPQFKWHAPGVPDTTNPFRCKPFIGRTEELARATLWLKKQSNSSAGLLVIKGEPGVGKTRLLREICEHAEPDWQLCHSVCHEFGEELAFMTLANWLRTPAIFEKCVKLSNKQRQALSAILPELAVPSDKLQCHPTGLERYHVHQLYEAALTVFSAQHSPLLFLIDNLQWCDRETITWLNFIASRNTVAAYSVICTQRMRTRADSSLSNSFLTNYQHSNGFTLLTLHSLNSQDSQLLLRKLLPDCKRLIISKAALQVTRGLPLLLLELARCTLELYDDDGHPSLGIRNFILARVETLEPLVQDLLELCATFGRPFTVDELLDIGNHSQIDMIDGLDTLWSKAFLELLDRNSDTELYVLHDLVRQYVYEHLTPLSRCRKHLQIAEYLQRIKLPHEKLDHTFAAHHYFRAKRYGDALHHHLLAATNAKNLNMTSQEATELEASISCLRHLPETRENKKTRIEILLNLGLARSSMQAWGAESVGQAWQSAYEQVNDIDDISLKARVLNAYDTFMRDTGQWHKCKVIGQKSYRLRSEIQDPYLVQSLESSRAALLLHTGYPAESLILYGRIIEATTDNTINASYRWFNSTHRIGAHFRSAQCLWLLGRVDEGAEMCHQALELAKEKSDPFHLAITIFHVCLFYEFKREHETVIHHAKKLLALAEKYKFCYYTGAANLFKAYANINLSSNVKELQTMEKITRYQDAIGTKMFDTYWLANLASAKILVGDYQGALQVAIEGLCRSRVSKNNFWNSELERICVDASLKFNQKRISNEFTTQPSCYARAIAIAKKQGSVSLFKRAKHAQQRSQALGIIM